MKFTTFLYLTYSNFIELIIGVLTPNINLTIVTGSDSTHFYSMLQLINSIKIFNVKRTNIICYDLGLSETEIAKLADFSPDIILKKFDFSAYPSFYNIKFNSGEYAWKSAIIKEEYSRIPPNGFILWLDAGCFIIKKLNIVTLNLILSDIFSSFSDKSIGAFTHENTITKLGLKKHVDLPMLNAGIIGLKSTKQNTSFINEWYNSCKQKDIIAPEGSSRQNHRQDQSVYSLLFYNYYTFNFLKRVLKSDEILIHKDIG